MASYLVTQGSAEPRHISDVMQSVLARYDLGQSDTAQLPEAERKPCKPLSCAAACLSGQPAVVDAALA